MNPTAKVASDSNVAASGLPTTKNCLSNTSTAHAANAKKSYHSSVVPMVQANIRLARFLIALCLQLCNVSLLDVLRLQFDHEPLAAAGA